MTQARPRTGGDGQGSRAPARHAVTQREPAGEASREGDRASGVRHDLGIDMDAVRQSGIEVVGAVPWGTHFCQFYQTRQDLVETLVPYFREGLAANEFCMWVTSPPLQVEEAKAALLAAVPSLDDCMARGQIEILDYSDWYTKGGEFRPDDVLQGWVDKHDDARRRGYEGLRLTGNTFWLEPTSWDDFTQYEEQVDSIIGQYRMLAVCTYSLEKCGAGEIADVIANHEFALVKRSGQWQIIESARHKLTEAALRESEERFRTLAEASFEGIVIHDGRDILAANQTMTAMLGCEPSELIGIDGLQMVAPEWRRLARQNIDSGYEGRYEVMVLRKNGTAFPAEIRGKPMSYQGRTARVIAVRDLTERKQAEEALRESARHYRLLADNVTDLIWTTDLKLRSTYASPSILWLLGYTVEEAMALKLNDILAPESLDLVKKAYAEEIGGGNLQEIDPHRSRTLELQVYRRDGALIWVEANVTLLRDSAGLPAGLLGVSRDITERKRAEEELRESEKRYRLLAENVTDVIWAADMRLNLTYISPSAERLWGYSVEERMALPLEDLLTPASLELARSTYAQAMAVLAEDETAASPPLTLELEVIRKDGCSAWAEVTMTLLRDPDGRSIGILGVSRGITERKRAEEALRESERRYRLLAENASDVIWTADLDLNLTYISPSIQQVSGFTIEECMAQARLGTLTPESLERVRRVHADTLATELGQRPLTGSQTVEAEARRKDGSTAWIEAKVSFLRDPAGRPVGILGVSRDITERKRAEEALRESEKRYRLLAENVSDVIWTTDLNLKPTYISPSAERLWGYTAEERMAMGMADILTPASRELARKTYAAVLASEAEQHPLTEPRTAELEARRKDGSIMWSEAKVTFLRDADGKPVGILGVSRDVTRRKLAELALRESEAKFRTLAEAAPAAIFIIQGTKVRYANPAAEALIGHTLEEQGAMGFLDVVPPDLRELARERVLARQRGEDVPSRYEFKVMSKGGEERWVDFAAGLIEFEGEPAVIGAAYDITERKQAEEALRSSEANYRAIFSSASDAIVVYDSETARMVDVNPRFCEIFGYTPEEARQLRLEDLGSGEPPYTEEEAVKWVKEAAELEIGPFEFRAKDKAGRPVWVEGSLRLVVIEGREYLLGIGHDIGERKQAEEALQKARDELENRVEREMQRGNSCGLTFRELTVLHLVAAGKADKEIGVELGISPQTASKHLANILSKMGAASRTEAGVRALREGLLE